MFPQLRCALFQIVHRPSYIVHGQTSSAFSRRFVTTSDYGSKTSRPHLHCSSRSSAAHYLQIVNRKSQIVNELTHRHHPALVASESPHDSSPLRGKSYAFGQTDLQPSPVFTPAGQRIHAVYSPPAALLRIICKSYIENRKSYMSSCLAAAWGRRACCTSYIGAARRHRPAQRARISQIVHRTSYIVHRRVKRLRRPS